MPRAATGAIRRTSYGDGMRPDTDWPYMRRPSELGVIMYWVGSAGTVDPADAGKVVCIGSVLQLGQGLSALPPEASGGQPPPVAEEAADIAIPSLTATVRYAVVPDVGGTALNELWLGLRYRAGDGSIAANLFEVPLFLLDVALGDDPGTVPQTQLLHFDSAASTTFRTDKASGLSASDPTHVLDFANYAYYVEVSITSPAIETPWPPAVAAVGVGPIPFP
jgi:hypothetical protein